MADFECSICGVKFSIPESVLAKYPGWTPRFCREHSQKKNSTSEKKIENNSYKYPATSVTATQDLTPEEVLKKIKPAGPNSGIFTDGSARPNPGPGGWGFVWVKNGDILQRGCGSSPETTNNRMEMTALIHVLKMLPLDAEETIYSDSNLSVNTLNSWAVGWEKNGWKRKAGAIENLDLVKEAYALFKQHPKVKLEWIKAHCGWLWNEYANAMAISWTVKK